MKTKPRTFLAAALVAGAGVFSWAEAAPEEEIVAFGEAEFWLGGDEVSVASDEGEFWLGPDEVAVASDETEFWLGPRETEVTLKAGEGYSFVVSNLTAGVEIPVGEGGRYVLPFGVKVGVYAVADEGVEISAVDPLIIENVDASTQIGDGDLPRPTVCEPEAVASGEGEFWLGPDEVAVASGEGEFWLGPRETEVTLTAGDGYSFVVSNLTAGVEIPVGEGGRYVLPFGVKVGIYAVADEGVEISAVEPLIIENVDGNTKVEDGDLPKPTVCEPEAVASGEGEFWLGPDEVAVASGEGEFWLGPRETEVTLTAGEGYSFVVSNLTAGAEIPVGEGGKYVLPFGVKVGIYAVADEGVEISAVEPLIIEKVDENTQIEDADLPRPTVYEPEAVASGEGEFWLGPDEVAVASDETEFWLGPRETEVTLTAGDGYSFVVSNLTAGVEIPVGEGGKYVLPFGARVGIYAVADEGVEISAVDPLIIEKVDGNTKVGDGDLPRPTVCEPEAVASDEGEFWLGPRETEVTLTAGDGYSFVVSNLTAGVEIPIGEGGRYVLPFGARVGIYAVADEGVEISAVDPLIIETVDENTQIGDADLPRPTVYEPGSEENPWEIGEGVTAWVDPALTSIAVVVIDNGLPWATNVIDLVTLTNKMATSGYEPTASSFNALVAVEKAGGAFEYVKPVNWLDANNLEAKPYGTLADALGVEVTEVVPNFFTKEAEVPAEIVETAKGEDGKTYTAVVENKQPEIGEEVDDSVKAASVEGLVDVATNLAMNVTLKVEAKDAASVSPDVAVAISNKLEEVSAEGKGFDAIAFVDLSVFFNAEKQTNCELPTMVTLHIPWTVQAGGTYGVVRMHGNPPEAQAIPQGEANKTKDGEFFTVDVEAGEIVLRVSKFSDYAVAETPPKVGENAYARVGDDRICTIYGEGVATNFPAEFDRGSFTNVVIEDGITEIGESFFFECSKLKAVTLGKDVVRIGANAFLFCQGLEKVEIRNPDIDTRRLAETISYHAAIRPDGTLYTIPSVSIAGYEEVLYGTVSLTKPDWQPVPAGTKMEASGCHFFKFVLKKCP